MNPQQKVSHYIASRQLFAPTDKLLVALSGGADSVALLRLLLSLGYDCRAAHCNFQLRGDESDQDEAFVRALCEELHVPLQVRSFGTLEEASRRKVSIEMAARELRYAWFEELRQGHGLHWIAVAHHRDDSVETLLLNLIRGTGIHGLTGIRPRNGKVVRPLLCLNRAEIEEYLSWLGQPYMTDSTNLKDDYLRNKIRLDLLPLMQRIHPAVKESLQRTTEHLHDAELLYNRGIAEALERVRVGRHISIAALQQEASPGAVLFEVLHPLGFHAAQLDRILASLHGQSGKQFRSATHRVVKDRELLLIESVDERTADTPPFTLRTTTLPMSETFQIPRSSSVACLDADTLQLPLTLRRLQQGDRFVPLGMKGQKLVSDYLTDRKYSLPDKAAQWVLCSGEQIVWLVGERIDHRFRLTDSTRSIYQVELLP
ncbi:MAG: tRNA lysidine(34) synthetase TilS [Prevotellaceae bacterium]|jgi:tRNA(Ile)-lysidine synthase|nr:tRNA lysidine(34) synthetase TilS [Prevotellaceae bacterium]